MPAQAESSGQRSAGPSPCRCARECGRAAIRARQKGRRKRRAAATVRDGGSSFLRRWKAWRARRSRAAGGSGCGSQTGGSKPASPCAAAGALLPADVLCPDCRPAEQSVRVCAVRDVGRNHPRGRRGNHTAVPAGLRASFCRCRRGRR